MEFTMKALLLGIRTTWCHDAIVYDEKPLTFTQSWHQRKRWAQGHFDVASRYIPRLLYEGIRQRDIRILDGVLHSCSRISSSVHHVRGMQHIYHLVPFYTNILNMVLPMDVWTLIAVASISSR
jgi:cellulose synthase/poly-beta-1,6-N-acetylglucosamine synthase-like glycosyltransferase